MRRLFLLLLILLPWVLGAQGGKPEWCDASIRGLSYPDKTYYTGFAMGQRGQGENTRDALARIENDARANAAKHIKVRVESNTLDQMESLQQESRAGLDESIRRYFSQENVSSTSIEIANLQVLSWRSADGNEVAALAYVKKRDFARYHDRQIESLLGKMETALDNVANQEQQGQKIKAVKTAEDALQLCPSVEYSQRMVALSDPEASTEDLQIDRYMTAVHNLVATITRLKHATAFYVCCKASIGEEGYTLLDKEIRGLLAEKGCHFADNRNDADWMIEIEASVINTTHRDGMPHFVYVDGTLRVTNGTTQQKVLENRLSSLENGHPDGIKGGDFNADKAARIAYRDAARIITESILKLAQE